MRKAGCAIPLLCGAMAAMAGGAADAATSTSRFQVTMAGHSECRLTSTSDMAFGMTGIIQTALTQTGTITVQCTNSTPYQVGMDAGGGSGATTTTRRMMGATGDAIDYSLYRDSAHTQIWGNGGSSDTMSAITSGDVRTHTVYGRVPPQATEVVGNYGDVVQVTITY